jgi:hypothetical protein
MSDKNTRWSKSDGKVPSDPAIDSFLDEIKEVCKKHGLSISHEDSQGGFIIEKYSDSNLEWLFAASDHTK